MVTLSSSEPSNIVIDFFATEANTLISKSSANTNKHYTHIHLLIRNN